MRERFILLTLLVLTLSLSGCVGLSAPFSDDFSDPASGWGASSHETYVRGYQQGRYLIQIDVPQWFVWSYAGKRYKDVAIDCETQSEGTPDNHYGIMCRYTEGNFYYFAISSDGYYGIYRRLDGGDLEPLTGPAMLRSSRIVTGGGVNRLLAVCDGDNLKFYVNGELIAEAEDDALSKGDIGLAAGTLEQGGTVVWFKDIEVTDPNNDE
ncbi:MAG: hypothetical protein JW981_04010 [Anaerolineae bacterium]|nr:hypothetical protein [Anaerolineae bacterium]